LNSILVLILAGRLDPRLGCCGRGYRLGDTVASLGIPLALYT